MPELGPVEILIISPFIITPFICAVVGAWIANNKGRNPLGWFFLCLFVPIMLILLMFLAQAEEVNNVSKKCPYCREFIKWDAKVCRYCSRNLPENKLDI